MRVRLSGVLLHISSLPSSRNIGDLGPSAHAFARLLAECGQSAWQFLPLGPTSPAIGNSPYSSPSAFAGNALFISPELLVQEGFISHADCDAACAGDFGRETVVDYVRAEKEREALLDAAFEKNRHRLDTDAGFAAFRAEHAFWLDDYARFMTIKRAHGGAVWTRWPEKLARRDPSALAAWDNGERDAMQRERFIQYLFFRQWAALRAHCRKLGLRLIGDAPIYVTHDSADVWANPCFFKLDGAFEPTVVAGVPPDYFSATGQRWGNPVYEWEALRHDGFRWWIQRLEHNLLLFDTVRLDHFRGFAGYWEIPATEKTAVNGKWVEAPGDALFAVLARRMGHLPFIAEDLGVITPDVRELQRDYRLPGMAILQFAFGGGANPYAPFRLDPYRVVYPGTHDNAPTKGWFCCDASHEEKENLAAYAGHEITEENCHKTLLRLAHASVAGLSIVPMQDVLGLGMDARMNTPSVAEGNWTWRMRPDDMRTDAMSHLTRATSLFGRIA